MCREPKTGVEELASIFIFMSPRRTPFLLFGGGIVSLLFFGAIGLAAWQMPRYNQASQRVIDEFFGASQQGDYDRAYAQLSPIQRADLTPTQFREQWRAFDARHGKIVRWQGAEDGSSGLNGRLINLWPPFVDATMAVVGTRNGGRLFALRLAPRDGRWYIERFRVMMESEPRPNATATPNASSKATSGFPAR